MKKLLLVSAIAVAFLSPAQAGQRVRLPTKTLGTWCLDTTTMHKPEDAQLLVRGQCSDKWFNLSQNKMEWHEKGSQVDCKIEKIEAPRPMEEGDVKAGGYIVQTKCSGLGVSWIQKDQLWIDSDFKYLAIRTESSSPVNTGRKAQLPIGALGAWCADASRSTEDISIYTRDSSCKPGDRRIVLGPDRIKGHELDCKFTRIEEIVHGRTYDVWQTCMEEDATSKYKVRIWHVNDELYQSAEWLTL
jgi:hypothetical protein